MVVKAYLPRQLLFGEGSFQQLPVQLNSLAIDHAFIIYSGSAMKSNLTGLQQQLPHATYYKMPAGEPTLEMMEDCLQQLKQSSSDGIVAIGGGSALDLGKAVAAKSVYPDKSLMDFADMERIERLPFIAIPTTAGTGSEATKVTVITDREKGMKLNPGHVDLIPDVAILDPALTVAVPAHITAFTALDALTHAIEAYVSTNASIISDFYALQAVTLITRNIETVYEQPNNIEARGELLLGSYYAGIAFSNASTNLAHATGRALGVQFLLPHGQSVALMHPFVIAFSMDSSRERYQKIARLIGLEHELVLIDYLNKLNVRLGVWQSALGILDDLTEQTIDDMTIIALSGNGILTNRQVPTKEDISEIFETLQQRLQNERGA